MESNDKLEVTKQINDAAERYDILKQIGKLSRQVGYLEGVLTSVLLCNDDEVRLTVERALTRYREIEDK